MFESTSLTFRPAPRGRAIRPTFSKATRPIAISHMPMVGECSRLFVRSLAPAATFRLDITTGVAPVNAWPAPDSRCAPMTFVVVRGTEARLTIAGSLDGSTVSDVRPTIDDLVRDKPRRVTLDLGNLSLIDSVGIGIIVSLSKRVTSNGGEVVIVDAREQPLLVLKLLQLERTFGLAS